jgi:hypothetical protein
MRFITNNREQMSFIGYSLDDFVEQNAKSRFRNRHLELLPDYFVQMVRLAKEKELTEFKGIAMDGSKIQASASARKSKDSDTLSRYLKAVRKDIAEYMVKCELAENEGTDDLEEIREKIGQLQKRGKTLFERKAQLAKRKEGIKPEHRKKHKINIVEPDAIMMDKVNGKQKTPAYNVQVSVDTESQLICGNDVVQDRNDQNQFSKQHDNVEKNLGTDAEREYTTNAGYHSLEQLEYIGENQIKATVADPNPENRSISNKADKVKKPEELLKEKEKFERSDFVFNREGDCYECPAGKKLKFEEDIGDQAGEAERTKLRTVAVVPIKRIVCLPTTNQACDGYTGMIVKYTLRKCLRNCKATRQRRN